LSLAPALRVFFLAFTPNSEHTLREFGEMAAIFIGRGIGAEIWITFDDGTPALYENSGGAMGYTIRPGGTFTKVRLENRIGGAFSDYVVLSPSFDFVIEGIG